MLFPIQILEEGKKVTDLSFSDGVGYVVARDGFYKKVKTRLFEYLVKIDNAEVVDGLAKTIAPFANTFTGIIPRSLLRQIEAFFRKAYEAYHGEAVVLLYFNPDKKEWMVRVPPQKVRGLHVTYDTSEAIGEIDGFYLASSIHSHAAAGAFHSSVDDHDEVEFDGLHITIGNVDKSVRSYAVRWMLGRTSFITTIDQVLELETDLLPEVPDVWMQQVSEEQVIKIDSQPAWSFMKDTMDYPIGMNDVPCRHTKKSNEVYTDRNVTQSPFDLVYDFEALVERA